ncbi:uncharacterized protein LOC134779222 [Penaeus indicus]|uniref:uncharacterized protein LOC134779222 n=1 Tax=Penaeus indicus TaxID=29960 RepID=UPI00300DA806
MNIPKFIKTDWWGHGRAILKFSATEASGENAEEKDKGGGIIECYISSVMIREYTEKRRKKNDEQEESSCGKAVEELKTEAYPPDVPLETWQDWLIHWELWKEVYISLSWVNKYRKLCKPDYIQWYDSYIENYPDILPLILEGLGEVTEDLEFFQEDSVMEIEAQTQKGNESNTDISNSDKANPNLETNEKADKKKKLDALYDKHSEDRYWIHLRRFLLQSGITKTDKLEEFFNRSASLKYCDTENYDNANEGALEEESCYNTSENDSVLLNTDKDSKTADNFPMYSSEEDLPLNRNTSKASRKSDDDSYENEEHIEKKFKSAGEEQDKTNKEENENEYSLPTKMLKQEETDDFDMDEVPQVKEREPKRKNRKKPKKAGLSHTSGLAWAVQILQKHSDGTGNTDENEAHIESLRDSETQVAIPLDSSIASFNNELSKNTCPDISSSLDGKHSKTEVSPVNESVTNTKSNNCKGSTSNSTLSLGIVENNSDLQTLQDSEQMVTSSKDDKNEMEKQKSGEFVDSKIYGLLKWFTDNFLIHGIRILYPFISDPLYGMIKLILRSQPQPSVSCNEPDLNSEGSRKTRSQRRNLNNAQKKFSRWLKPLAFAYMDGNGFEELHLEEFEVYEELRESQVLYQKVEENGPGDLQLLTLNLYDLEAKAKNMTEEPSKRTHITFDEDANPNTVETISTYVDMPTDMEYQRSEEEIWNRLTQGHTQMKFKIATTNPVDIPETVSKYWAQRYRLFLKYDKGIKLDTESWFSVTPETIAIHHAYRCRCDVVVDAFCGAGGNAIHLAETCKHVVAIDIDPEKIALAYHNATVYGVADRIDFIVGDFFKLAPFLKADVVYLSPPWGGTQYMQEKVYNVKALGGLINCETLIATAQEITKDIAVFLPKNSDLYQIIELAGFGNSVDIEYSLMGNKVKALTAYFGDLVYC